MMRMFFFTGVSYELLLRYDLGEFLVDIDLVVSCNRNTRLANSGKQPVKPKTIKLVFAASPKHTAVGSYSKDWLDQNQEMCLNVFHSVIIFYVMVSFCVMF
jgi:hypothetical protein